MASILVQDEFTPRSGDLAFFGCAFILLSNDSIKVDNQEPVCRSLSY